MIRGSIMRKGHAMKRTTCFAIIAAGATGSLTRPVSAQTPPGGQNEGAAAAPASVGVAPGAATPASPRAGTFSLAIERVGGIAYGSASASKSDDSGSLLTVGLGLTSINP